MTCTVTSPPALVSTEGWLSMETAAPGGALATRIWATVAGGAGCSLQIATPPITSRAAHEEAMAQAGIRRGRVEAISDSCFSKSGP